MTNINRICLALSSLIIITVACIKDHTFKSKQQHSTNFVLASEMQMTRSDAIAYVEKKLIESENQAVIVPYAGDYIPGSVWEAKFLEAISYQIMQSLDSKKMTTLLAGGALPSSVRDQGFVFRLSLNAFKAQQILVVDSHLDLTSKIILASGSNDLKEPQKHQLIQLKHWEDLWPSQTKGLILNYYHDAVYQKILGMSHRIISFKNDKETKKLRELGANIRSVNRAENLKFERVEQPIKSIALDQANRESIQQWFGDLINADEAAARKIISYADGKIAFEELKK